MSTKTEITFEQGSDELKAIVAELQQPLALNDTVAKVKRGHGLARTLEEHLTGLEAELRDIEEGKGLPEFEIVAPPEEAGPHFSRARENDEIPF